MAQVVWPAARGGALRAHTLAAGPDLVIQRWGRPRDVGWAFRSTVVTPSTGEPRRMLFTGLDGAVGTTDADQRESIGARLAVRNGLPGRRSVTRAGGARIGG